jgi:hypothetical protein
MVGDPAQLPATVMSRTAKEQDYHQSLFKRLYKSFASGIGPDGQVRDVCIPYWRLAGPPKINGRLTSYYVVSDSRN